MRSQFITIIMLAFLTYAQTWNIETVDSGGVGGSSSLAMDSSDYPHISYHEFGGGLKYAFWNGSSWEIEIVDSANSVGINTSLVLASSDYPHISYYDYSNDGLRYAFWNGSSWDRETVDSAGWGNISLALDSSDYPHISYLDINGSNLMYASLTETGIEGGSDYPLALLPITPNPAFGIFSVNFSIPESANISLNIYNMSGSLVRQTPSTIYSLGLHQINFSDLETGVYLCRITSGEFTATQKFVVIK